MIWTPALLTSRSSAPNSRAICSMPALTCSSFVTSISMELAIPPDELICSATTCAALRFTSAIATRAPAIAKALAIDFPIPLPAPVISADLPLSFISSLFITQKRTGDSSLRDLDLRLVRLMTSQIPPASGEVTPSYPPCVEHGIWSPIPVAPPAGLHHLKFKEVDADEARAIRERGIVSLHTVGCSGDFKEHLP